MAGPMTHPLPHIPWGTHLSLRAGAWYVEPGVEASHDIEIRVVAIQHVTADVVSIDAHGLDCKWQSVNCQEPWCLQVLAPLTVLYDAADRTLEMHTELASESRPWAGRCSACGPDGCKQLAWAIAYQEANLPPL